jgi:hypothetical protein
MIGRNAKAAAQHQINRSMGALGRKRQLELLPRRSGKVQVSRTLREPFEQRGTLPGVGEALKREIAGLVLADRLCLWGFEGRGCLGSDWASRVRRVRGLSVITGFSGSPTT